MGHVSNIFMFNVSLFICAVWPVLHIGAADGMQPAIGRSHFFFSCVNSIFSADFHFYWQQISNGNKSSNVRASMRTHYHAVADGIWMPHSFTQ